MPEMTATLACHKRPEATSASFRPEVTVGPLAAGCVCDIGPALRKAYEQVHMSYAAVGYISDANHQAVVN